MILRQVPPPNKAKAAVVRDLLEHGLVSLHIDARAPDVDVPPAHRKNFRLVLEIGYGLAVPIRDLEIGDEALTATLSFERRPYRCRVPWEALFAATDQNGDGRAWPASFPPEIQREFLRAMDSSVTLAPASTPELPASTPPATAKPPDESPPAPSTARRGHLRLLK